MATSSGAAAPSAAAAGAGGRKSGSELLDKKLKKADAKAAKMKREEERKEKVVAAHAEGKRQHVGASAALDPSTCGLCALPRAAARCCARRRAERSISSCANMLCSASVLICICLKTR